MLVYSKKVCMLLNFPLCILASIKTVFPQNLIAQQEMMSQIPLLLEDLDQMQKKKRSIWLM